MIYIEPVNLKQWDMFREVTDVGHVEPFLATHSMVPGDLVLLHVGQQDKRYESGVYAYGTVVEGPFVLRGRPDDYCNGKNSVMVRIDRIERGAPIISHEACKGFTRQFRTVHAIDPAYGPLVERALGLHVPRSVIASDT